MSPLTATSLTATIGDATWCEVDGCGDETLGRVCGSCAVRFETALRSVPDLDTELELTRTRQDRTRTGGPVVSASPTRPLPFKEHPREAAADLWSTLASAYVAHAPEVPATPCGCGRLAGREGPMCWDAYSWAWEADRVIADRVPEPATLAGLAGWLLGHADDVLRHDDAAATVSAVLDAVRIAERAIDGPAPLVTAGSCEHCGLPLYGRLGRKLVICDPTREVDPGCGAVYSAQARREHLLEALRAHTATAAEIAHGVSELVGVHVDRRKLNVWATRIVDTTTDPRPKLPDRRSAEDFRAGQADPTSRRGHERLFRIGEVLDLITASAVEKSARRTARDTERTRSLQT